MKRILTILAIFMSMVCGSVFLVSCSDGYKKMYLQVEYAVYDDAGKFERWATIEDGKHDYTMTDNLYSSEYDAYILNLRVKVKGTSKKINSLYVSQSATTAVSLENKNVKPNEAFTVLVHNIGSVSFNITPSEGGEDKATGFKLNVYRGLTDIEQNSSCVPAVVASGNVKLDGLTNLIKYYPFDETAGVTQTNQTGVDYKLVAVGKLINNGQQNLLEREFEASTYGTPTQDGTKLIGGTGSAVVELLQNNGNLTLQTATNYTLTSENNVIKLLATSKYNSEKTATVYVFIVENFRSQSLLVSYRDDVTLDANGNLPERDANGNVTEEWRELGEEVTIYDALLDSPYKAISVYTYTSRSIYSFVSEPGIRLKVYVNNIPYNYLETTESNIGVKITPASTDTVNSVGLRFETNPLKADDASEYHIRIELDFTAFDFSASDTAPAPHLKKEFTLKVKSLASSFSINGKSYADNLDPSAIEVEGQNITYYNSNETAVIYSSYEGSLGMLLNIKAVPSNAVDVDVKTSFYANSLTYNDDDTFTGNNISSKIMLSENANLSLQAVNGEFVFTRQYANYQVYLKFSSYDSSIETVYMVCRVKSTPDMYNGEEITPEYITFIAKFDVVGAANSASLYKTSIGTENYDDTYLESEKEIKAYIDLNSNSIDVDLDSIIVSSENSNVRFSADGSSWSDNIKLSKLTRESNRYKLYFKSTKQCDEKILIQAPNGLNVWWNYSFVNVTSGSDKVAIEYEDTYIWAAETMDELYYTDKDYAGNDVNNTVGVKYLALQDGTTAQFMAKGDGKTANIKDLTAKSLLPSSAEYSKITKADGTEYYSTVQMTSYSSSAIKIPTQSTYLFDVRANTIGFTSIVFVKVDFYVKDTVDGKIIPKSKYFIYEIAVYVPAKDLDITLDNEQILFVNENYSSVATVEFTVSNNSSATSRITFSSTAVNDEIYESYGEMGYKSIYGINVNTTVGFEAIQNAGLTSSDYFSVVGLNKYAGIDDKYFVGRSRRFTLTALKDLQDLVDKGIQSVYFDFEIYQFGEGTVYTARKVIYFGNYTKVDGIVVGGIDNYSNLYMSLWDAAGGTVTKEIAAEPTNKDATYSDLGYELKKAKITADGRVEKDVNGNVVTEDMSVEYSIEYIDGSTISTAKTKNGGGKYVLIVEHAEGSNIFTIKAQEGGGVYVLTIFAQDSYDGTKYTESTSVLITVSDGKTDATAYLITKYEDFIKIDPSANLYYRLASDNIDLSALNDDWWDKERLFNGHLDGSMTINNVNTGVSITKRFPLKNLSITNSAFNDNGCFGLFDSIAEEASIRNVIFDNVSINIELDKDNTSSPVHIGVIAGINNGTIENCSIKLASSSVTLQKKTGEPDPSAIHQTYNIGLVVGTNNGTIAYDNQQSSDYAYMLDCASQGKLDVVVEVGNTNLNTNTNIYVGGIAGNNAEDGTISSTYKDLSNQSLRTLITGVVNIDVLTEYRQGVDPMTISSIGIGGAVGYNAGEVSQVAISGSIVANDGFNMGGIVGINANKVYECANYGMVLEGYALNDTYVGDKADLKYTGKTLKYYGAAGADELVLEQNIGGIIGYNTDDATKVENVRTLFMEFESGYVSVASAESHIQGLGNIAGIIGKASSNTQLIRGNVENFIIDEEGERTYNIIGTTSIYDDEGEIIGTHDANIAGLIASGSGAKAYLSFVQADFNIDNATFNEFGNGLTVNYTYFVGDVLADESKFKTDATTGDIIYELETHQSAEDNNYIVNNIIYTDDEGKKQVNIVKYNVDGVTAYDPDDTLESDIINAAKELEDVTMGESATEKYKVVWNKGEGINNDYPYLAYIDNSEIVPTLTIQPNKIIVNVDKDYYEDTVKEGNYFQRYIKGEANAKESGIYMQYLVEGADPSTTEDDRIRATAIVYYNKEGDNEYQLLTGEGDQPYGLIEKTILPAIANGGAYIVTIVSGGGIATIKDGDKTIEFRDVGKVVLKFTSAFNSEISDTVVIFVEYPLHDDTFELTTSTGITTQGSSYTTSVGQNPTLSVKLKDVDKQTFDSTKLYMTYSVGGAKDNDKEDVVNNGYFTLTALSKEIATDKYLLGDLQLEARDLPDDVQYINVPVTINIYLNLAKYDIDGTTLDVLLAGESSLIATRTINITIYNKATSLALSNDVKTEAGTGVDIVASLLTGYIAQENGTPDNLLSENGLYPSISGAVISGQDYVYAKLTALNENATKLLDEARLDAEKAGKVYNAWDIFDIIITYTTIKNGEYVNIGYKYNFNLRLKNEYRDLNLDGMAEKEWKFKIEIIAGSNIDLKEAITVSFVPQTLTTFRIENYSYLVARTATDNTSVVAEFTSSETESSMIVPGESGLLKIYAESDYAYFDNIVITSTIQEIDGQQYFVRFQQMVYDRENKVYKSYAGVTADGQALGLSKRSYINADGTYEYTGVIFVRTILDNIVGVRKTFTFNVTADTYDIDGNVVSISREKTVLSQYKPGVYIDVENALESSYSDEVVYLVENGSSNVTVVAKVYGYEFNVEPTRYWEYLDGSEVLATEVALTESSITQDVDGAFIVKYTMSVHTAKPFNLHLEMSLIENGNTLVGKSSKLIFYPVPYIIKSVHLNGEVNNTLSISLNSSKEIDLVWSTISTTEDKKNDINNQLLLNDNFLKMFYLKAFDQNGRVYNKTFDEIYTNQDTNFGFRIEKTNDIYYIRALAKNSITIHFDMYYRYILNNKKSIIEFSCEETSEFKSKFSYEFLLNLVVKTEENAPQPITKASELQEMSADGHYILMNDITVENWTPITAAIGSLDGNGKKIIIKSFNIAVQTTTNVGLFATIGANTIIKNLAIDISSLESTQYIRDDGVTNVSVVCGILAAVNQGLVYNCEVISVSKASNIEWVIGTGYNFTFGGLVGQNKGNITNSRVGTEYFESLTLDEGNNPISKIEYCYTISFKSRGVMAGFVGINDADCIISSCYVANTSIENTSNATASRNKTAGFVAENAGTVAYSYSKGLESSILNTQSRATGCKIYASGLGSVAGFVYSNTGTIHDCYSNIECESTSSAVAGFVYDASQGSIYQCYSASKVTAPESEDGLATRLPFVGIGVETTNAQQLLSNENMINCYYLDDDTVEYDKNYIVPEDAIEPKGIDLTTFATSTNLNNFAFITNGTQEQQLNAVWTYSTAIDRNKSIFSLGITSLPELTSANKISRSLRTNEIDVYGYLTQNNYANGYALGSSINPYIIRSVSEYNSVFVEGAENDGKTGIAGYVRFIDHISFTDGSDNSGNTKYIDISTRSGYTLGDSNTFTLIDGNGMTISDVVINYTKEETGTLGLFSQVEYALIKGLNVTYASVDSETAGSTRATAVGGLAGVANNTYFIDINLEGNGSELHAHNIIGGVVGVLKGDRSGLYNINSDLLVASGANETSKNWTQTKVYSDLSYAGGIVGIVDDATNKIYLNKLQVTEASVRADRAGGVAGYLGRNVAASRLTYFIPLTSQNESESATIVGRLVAGGVVAENRAEIKYSQATVEIDAQYEFDKAFADYINSGEEINANNYTEHAIDNSDGDYGNLNAVSSQNLAGGFVGYNYGGTIQDSMTKANIGPSDIYGNAQTIGGFVGEDVGGRYRFVYAQNYIDLTTVENKSISVADQAVGGFAGKISYASADVGKDVVINNVVVMTFFDKAQLWDVYNDDENARPVDYIVGSIDNDVTLVSAEGEPGSTPIINYGRIYLDILTTIEGDGEEPGGEPAEPEQKVMPIEVGALKTSTNEGKKFSDAQSNDMRALYNLQAENQKSIFESLFINWDTNYWDLDNTRFMPNLRVDNAPIFIEIESEEDLIEFERNPDGNFILMKDVPLYENYSNYVANIEFTGILIGKLQSNGQYPSFMRITLNADTANSSGAGFFRQTTEARISNVNFAYNEISLSGDTTSYTVGGVSSKDIDSRFENIIVSGTDGDNNDVYCKNNSKVASIGSIVGDSTRSTLISCRSSLDYNILADSSSNIGGLIGTIDGSETIDGQLMFSGLITSSTYSGLMKVTGDGFSVGGIASYAYYTYIQSCNVLVKGDERTADTAINVILSSNSSNNYFGGIVANSNQAAVTYCGALIDIKVNDDKTAITSATYYIGGLVAQEQNSGMIGDDINNSYATLKADVNYVTDVLVGGIASQVTHINTQFTSVVSKLTLTTSDVANVKIGGIIATLSGDNGDIEKTTIDDSVAYLAECDIAYTSSLVGGGLIGETTVGYSINNSMSIGQLWVNCSTDQTPSSSPSITILGGMVGLTGELDDLNPDGETTSVDKQKIANSYTVLTMSTANVYKGTIGGISHNIYTKSIVGYTTAQVNIINVLYSSDYTLAFEDEKITGTENSKFTTQPINVTANILMNNASNLISGVESAVSGKIGTDWSWSDGRLPVPRNLTDLLKALGITNESGAFIDGSAFKPYIINSKTEWDNFVKNEDEQAYDVNKYNYIVLTSSISNITTSFSDFKGVLLGNDMRISLENVGLFNNLQLHSAVSNVVVTLISGTYGGMGGIATTNDGTIFMCGVQYTDLIINNTFGGIAKDNNGTIAYCYNSGIAASVGNTTESGGLVANNNENATIEYSYFTGNLNSKNDVESAAIAYKNDGYIANCYSAGQAGKGFVSEIADKARYENNYFDYYGTFVTNTDYAKYGSGIIGKSTAEMQDGTSNSSNLLAGWLVYGMVTNGYTSGETAQPTYNYGYPIHNFNQYVYHSGVKDIDKQARAKYTGNGTFAGISDATTVKGKLVQDAEKKIDPNYEWYDNSSYLINNLGLLDYISEVETQKGTADKYFELEVGIPIPEDANIYYQGESADNYLLMNWKGIENFKGIFEGTGDKVEGKDYYELDTTLSSYEMPEGEDKPIGFDTLITKVSTDNLKTITNLRGNALFASVTDNAVITGVTMKDSIVNNATLIDAVGTEDEGGPITTASAIVYNVGVTGNIAANKNERIAGLIGSVATESTLAIHSIKYTEIKFDPITDNTALSVAGLITQNSGVTTIYNEISIISEVLITQDWSNDASGFIYNNVGTIEFKEASNIEIRINSDNSINTFSGFATTNSGKVIGCDSTIKIGGKINATTISGFAASMTKGAESETSVQGLSITFENSDVDDFSCTNLGGVIGQFSGGTLGIADDPINVSIKYAKCDVFGGVAAKISFSASNAKISNVILDANQINVEVNTGSLSAGLIIGVMEAELAEINYSLKGAITFNAQQFKEDEYGLTSDATSYSGGVGGIVGVSTVGKFTFENDKPTAIKIFANANVGGFIGLYKGDTSLTLNGDKIWALSSDEAYASINLLIPNSITSGEYYANNIGGLIGCWSPEVLEGLPKPALTSNVEIVNSNSVLTEDNKNVKYNKTNVDYMAYNIGGIVGFSTTGVENATNKAQIGNFDFNTTIEGITNPIYGRGNNPSINNINKYINVGGIAGNISADDSGAILSELSSIGKIDGIYCVGGLIGYSNYISNIKECTAGGEILGLAYVGGIIGRAGQVSTDDTGTKATTISDVIGVTNVGGIIGYADIVDITNCDVKANIMGNLNVGGIVGSAETISLTSCTTYSTDDEDNDRTISATIYDHLFDSRERAYYTFLPTNIGGIVGYVFGTDESSAKFENTISYITIKTEDECTLIDSNGNSISGEKITISLHKNRFGIVNKTTVSFAEMKKDHILNYYSDQEEYNYFKYDTFDGGIGGFIGKISAQIDFDGDGSYACSDIYAPYGINVGGVIGNTNQSIESLPNLSDENKSEVNIAGKLFVGGYIGKCAGFVSNEESGIDANTNKINIQKINNESVMAANCVGGIIGYSTGIVKGIKLTGESSNIKIYNSNGSTIESGYVGALVGRIDAVDSSNADMEECSIAPELCDAKKTTNGLYYTYNYTETINGVIQNPSTYNYGGLVGLVNVASGTTSTENAAIISGEHYYPFTVEMVQNQDYINGTTKSTLVEDYPYDVLATTAHYINQSNITISPSKLTGLYNGITEQDVEDHNPIKSNAKGWAKEYTMFRMMARLIPQDAPTGDSVQVVYNASYITGVKANFETKDGGIKISKDIIYTIYQPLNQPAKLYCKQGIATQFDHTAVVEGTQIIYQTGWNQVNVNNDGYTNLYKRYELENVDALEDELAKLLESNFDASTGLNEAYHLSLGSSYCSISNYLGGDTTYFAFDVVFGDWSTRYSSDRDTNYYSNSGSIFEVSGVSGAVATLEVIEEEAFNWQELISSLLLAVGVVLLVLFSIATYGAGIPAAVAAGMATFGGALTLSTAAALGCMAIVAGGVGVMTQWNNSGNTCTYHNYNAIVDSSYGALQAIYTRKITYNNSGLMNDADMVVIIPITAKLPGYNYVNGDENNFGDQKDEIKGMLEEGTIPLILGYTTACNSNILPHTYGEYVEVEVETLFDTNNDDRAMASFLEAKRIETVQVPKFVKVDNELYMYPESGNIIKVLYPSYDDDAIKNLFDAAGLIENIDIINDGGYAYAAECFVNDTALNLVKTDADGEYIASEFGINNWQISKTIPYTIKSGAGKTGAANPNVDLSKLYWNLSTREKVTDLDIEVRIANEGEIGFLSNVVAYYSGDTFKGYKGFVTKQAGWTEETVSLIKRDADDTDVIGEAILTTYDEDGKEFTSGYTKDEVEVSGTYHYVAYYADNPDGVEEDECKIKRTVTYLLACPKPQSAVKNVEPKTYNLTYMDDGEETTLVISKITEEGFNNIKGKYLVQPYYGCKVGDVYTWDGGVKEKITVTNIKEEETGSGMTVYYTPIYGEEYNNQSLYAYNKYIYQYNTDLILYTRFKYHADFLATVPEGASQQIQSLLFGKDRNNLLFSESCRVTLSSTRANTEVYIKYDTDSVNPGKISCAE